MSATPASGRDLYTAKTVKRVCDVTSRKLDYWIDTGVLYPVKVGRPRSKDGQLGRKIFLFSFENLVQVRTISALRNAGVSLQEIRLVVGHLRNHVGADWQDQWLVTDGQRVYVRDRDDPIGGLEEIGSGRRQLAFALVAMSAVENEVQERLSAGEPEPAMLEGRTVRQFKPSADARARHARAVR